MKLAKENDDNSDLSNNLGNLLDEWIVQNWMGKVSLQMESCSHKKSVWPIKDRELWERQGDKNVLLWREQGIGDDILFMGLVPEASEVSNLTTVYTDPETGTFV